MKHSATTLSPADKARALARYRAIRGRGGVQISFVAVGPTVCAADPDELLRATINAINEASGNRSA